MNKLWKEFFFRGLICAGGGPLVLAIIYGILGATGTVETLTPHEVCMGILSITLLAFIVAGMTAIYQLEQLPLLSAAMIHGAGLYMAYLLTYLLNGWLQQHWIPILIFTGIFVAGYAVIWLIIYCVTKAKANALNAKLNESR